MAAPKKVAQAKPAPVAKKPVTPAKVAPTGARAQAKSGSFTAQSNPGAFRRSAPTVAATRMMQRANPPGPHSQGRIDIGGAVTNAIGNAFTGLQRQAASVFPQLGDMSPGINAYKANIADKYGPNAKKGRP